MRHRKKLPAVLAVALLACVLAPSASALIACEDCQTNEKCQACAGVCNGVLASDCEEWFALGCGSFSAVASEETVSEVDLLRALNLQEERSVPADDGPAPDLTEALSAPSCEAPAP